MIGNRALFIASVGVALIVSPFASAHAEQYPSRVVTLVIPLPPGQTVDPLCRLLADKLRSILGQPFIIDSRPGAGGNIGGEYVARATPDGYTLLCAPEFSFLTQLIYSKMTFDPLTLKPVGALAAFPSVIVGRQGAPFGTLAELIAYARAHPGKLNYASQGQGSIAHLTFEALKMRAALDIVHVPYRGGGPAMNDLLAGQVDLYAGPLVGSFPHIQAGKLKLLAATGGKRLVGFPDVPALTEQFPGLEADTYLSIVAPPKTPKHIISMLSDAIAQAVASPEVRARILDLHAEPLGGTSEQLAERIRQNIERWKPVVKAAKISIE